MTGKTNSNALLFIVALGLLFILSAGFSHAQPSTKKITGKKSSRISKTIYGQASFYANKFHNRTTANGEKFSQDKMTAACNVLPLGTWIQVTNLNNGKKVIVRTNDRLHPNTRRLIDLTRTAAKKLGYIKRGLTRVKIEVLDQKKYKKFVKK